MKGTFLLMAIAVAMSHAYTLDTENVQRKLQQLNPTFMMLEELLNVEDKNQCVEKMFCLMETEMPFHESNPLKYYSRYLTNIFGDIDPVAFDRIQELLVEFPFISRVVNAIKVGQTNLSSDSCIEKFRQCHTDKDDLDVILKMLDENTIDKLLQNQHLLQKRSFCSDVKLICNLAKGGCLICAVITGGACGLLCGTGATATCAALKLGCFIFSK